MLPDPPATRREKLSTDPRYDLPCIPLRDRHKPVSERRELTTKGSIDGCSTGGII